MGYSPARQFGVRMAGAPNLLISLGFEICMNSVQAGEALDFQGFKASQCRLSTKLSTEFLHSLKLSMKSVT
jgi:hypothetical protein